MPLNCNFAEALCLGINDYQNETPLRKAVSDAENIAAVFRDLGCCNTVLETENLTKQKIEELVFDFVERTKGHLWKAAQPDAVGAATPAPEGSAEAAAQVDAAAVAKPDAASVPSEGAKTEAGQSEVASVVGDGDLMDLLVVFSVASHGIFAVGKDLPSIPLIMPADLTCSSEPDELIDLNMLLVKGLAQLNPPVNYTLYVWIILDTCRSGAATLWQPPSSCNTGQQAEVAGSRGPEVPKTKRTPVSPDFLYLLACDPGGSASDVKSLTSFLAITLPKDGISIKDACEEAGQRVKELRPGQRPWTHQRLGMGFSKIRNICPPPQLRCIGKETAEDKDLDPAQTTSGTGQSIASSSLSETQTSSPTKPQLGPVEQDEEAGVEQGEVEGPVEHDEEVELLVRCRDDLSHFAALLSRFAALLYRSPFTVAGFGFLLALLVNDLFKNQFGEMIFAHFDQTYQSSISFKCERSGYQELFLDMAKIVLTWFISQKSWFRVLRKDGDRATSLDYLVVVVSVFSVLTSIQRGQDCSRLIARIAYLYGVLNMTLLAASILILMLIHEEFRDVFAPAFLIAFLATALLPGASRFGRNDMHQLHQLQSQATFLRTAHLATRRFRMNEMHQPHQLRPHQLQDLKYAMLSYTLHVLAGAILAVIGVAKTGWHSREEVAKKSRHLLYVSLFWMLVCWLCGTDALKEYNLARATLQRLCNLWKMHLMVRFSDHSIQRRRRKVRFGLCEVEGV
ncbi:unnamed protein product [Durusdinium trenchii]|uniref:Peptidase C14 caspase domain-containing protein n=1 Tax=Durusdinium trenchii TaxID=1381693 RepID=A0ABP0IV90_9DINO